MTTIVCIDERDGLSFLGKRQSRDAAVRDFILRAGEGGRLLMNAYSAKQFESTDGITVSEDPVRTAREGDVCFVENLPVPLDAADTVITLLWNRHYPADVHLDRETLTKHFTPIKTEEFAGKAHEKITVTTYRRNTP